MDVVAYDTETTGLYRYQGHRMFAFSTCDSAGKTSVHRLDGSSVGKVRGRRELERLWSRESVSVVMHNAKFDLTMTEAELGTGLVGRWKDRVHCTHKMSHILQNHHLTHSLEDLSWDLARYPRIDSEISKLAKQCGGYHKVPVGRMTRYQEVDAERGMLLYLFFWPMIAKNPKWLDCYLVERDLIWTTMQMEKRGVMLHRGRCQGVIDRLEREVDSIRDQVYAVIGRRFVITSDAEIRRVLFRDLGMPVLTRTEKSGQPSVDKSTLMSLRENHPHPVLDLILKYRSYTKGRKMLQGYLELVDGNGIIHPNINTCQAITGRESCQNPNLQNVAKSDVLLNPFPVPARIAFRPRPGYVTLYVDYAGIELRLLVHYSQDGELVVCLVSGDGDCHSLAAETFYGGRFRDGSAAERKRLRSAAKNGSFAIAYGANPLKLSGTLGLPYAEGAAAFRRYVERWPKLAHLTKTISKQVYMDGYVETVFGRRLHVPKEKAYVGTNYLIQGTAAEILKRAQNRVEAYNPPEVMLVLPIHDELVIEYPRNRLRDLGDYLRGLRRQMTEFPGKFSVPLDIEASISTSSWEKKTPVEIPA